jgi:Mrp family chromosome partitioning ATPase
MLAWIGATLLGKRVLFVDAGRVASRWQAPSTLESLLGPDQRKVLLDVALGHAAPEEAIVTAADRSLFASMLQHERAGGSAILAAPQIIAVLEHLRTSFDMIVIAPSASLDGPLAAILKTTVDGSIIVVESGVTRATQMARCASLLSSGDSLLIGTVMWHRNPIPRLLRRWF